MRPERDPQLGVRVRHISLRMSLTWRAFRALLRWTLRPISSGLCPHQQSWKRHTSNPWAAACRTPVHPRMRGEHGRSTASSHDRGSSPHARGTRCGRVHVRDDGSSPHARGTPRSSRRAASQVRFIPACAGNTSRLSTDASPRFIPACAGNTTSIVRRMRPRPGSSPHARGTPRPTRRRRRARPVHPRMRGEHATSALLRRRRFGSSPHARGTRPRARRVEPVLRFIPACAGNTAIRRDWSDRVRRFIPACAGNTRRPWRSRSPVHPRMRGERICGALSQ